MKLYFLKNAALLDVPKALETSRPLKLSLKNETGKKENRNFLGLGSDDDWILNSIDEQPPLRLGEGVPPFQSIFERWRRPGFAGVPLQIDHVLGLSV